jgi:hypothetical protein
MVAIRGFAAVTVRAMAAILLLVSIAADLAGDSRCHPVSSAASGTSVSTSVTSPDEDPCAEGCVPDCYCCSVLSRTSTFRLTAADQPFVVMAAPAEPAVASGVAAALYRPPLSIL